MFLSRIFLVFSISLLFLSASFAGLPECYTGNPNDVLQPSGDISKEDVCAATTSDGFKQGRLYYYVGAKAYCESTKADFCATVEKAVKADMKPGDILDWGSYSYPLKNNYAYAALSYCGLDADGLVTQFCDGFGNNSGGRTETFERYCSPAQVSAYADKSCAGRTYSGYDASSSAEFCVRNYKGKLPAGFYKDNKNAKSNKPKFDSKNIACRPKLTLDSVKYNKENKASSASNSSSSSGSSSSSSSSGSSNAPAPSAPAPSGVDDALNKAKKIKDLFNF